MRKIWDVQCESCSKVTEVFGRDSDSFRCGACGAPAKLIISPVRCKLEGYSGSFPGAAMKWEREHIKAGLKNGQA